MTHRKLIEDLLAVITSPYKWGAGLDASKAAVIARANEYLAAPYLDDPLALNYAKLAQHCAMLEAKLAAPEQSAKEHDYRLACEAVFDDDHAPEQSELGYATRLAEAIYKQHYKDDAPEWKPLPDLMGVLTQIDNMFADLYTHPAPKSPEQEPLDVTTLLTRFERQCHRKGELWERCQGKGWPTAESEEFAALRDEKLPSIRAELLALYTNPAPEAEQEPFGWFKQSELEQAKLFGGSINLWLAKHDCDTPTYTHPAPKAEPVNQRRLDALKPFQELFKQAADKNPTPVNIDCQIAMRDLRALVYAVDAAAEQAPQPGLCPWQPIETAPKDGTPVLLTHAGGRIAEGSWHRGYEVWSWPYVMVEPTQWMPRPPVAVIAAQGAKA